MGVIYGYHGPPVLLEQLWEEEKSVNHQRFFSILRLRLWDVDCEGYPSIIVAGL